jgi:hypothetical protein
MPLSTPPWNLDRWTQCRANGQDRATERGPPASGSPPERIRLIGILPRHDQGHRDALNRLCAPSLDVPSVGDLQISLVDERRLLAAGTLRGLARGLFFPIFLQGISAGSRPATSRNFGTVTWAEGNRLGARPAAPAAGSARSPVRLGRPERIVAGAATSPKHGTRSAARWS